MLRPARFTSAVALVLLFLCVAVGGSAPVSDRGGLGGASSSGGYVPAIGSRGVPKATAAPFPTGGRVLGPVSVCAAPPQSTVTAATLQAGIRRLTSPQWRSADGGVSAALPDGRVLWFFGDTIKTPTANPGGMLGNSLLVSSGSCFTQFMPTGGGAVIPDEGSGAGSLSTWPTGAFAVNRGSWTEVYVFGNRVRRTTGMWGFTLLGTNLTRIAVPRGGAPHVVTTVEMTADDASTTHITWGASCVLLDGWVYIYGTRVVPGSLGREVYVARAPLADVQDPARWIYAGVGGWGGADRAVPVLDASPGTSHIISVFPRGMSWYVVSKAGGDFGSDVGVWVASRPAGPFRLIERVPRSYHEGGTQVRYMPLAHPEFTTGSTIVVSMSRNVTGGAAIASDYSLGRPEYFDLRLP